VRVCVIHQPTGYCLGCLRNLDEIAAWGMLSSDEKRALLARLPPRQAIIARHINQAKK
jgi:hypothetical protein